MRRHSCLILLLPAQLRRKKAWVPHPDGLKNDLKFVKWDTGKELFQDSEKDRLQARVVGHLMEELKVRQCKVQSYSSLDLCAIQESSLASNWL